MIAFLDVNTLWRRKFAEALARRVPGVVLCAPYAVNGTAEPGGIPIALPPGWASRVSALAMPLLLYTVNRIARRQGRTLETIVVTTPHYWPLVRHAARVRRIVYYCSDDYRAYAGWNPGRMRMQERALCRRATLSIFVSEALRARAVAEYGLDPARTCVSPNATEPRFAEIVAPAAEIAALARPVFGTAGVLNARIDLAFLARVAADPRVGSLALVGPVEAGLEGDPALAMLRASDKVHFFGRQPHDAMHAWMSAFEVAVIPYAATPLNRFCSPMRLYDHRAIGHPILATTHCEQVVENTGVLTGGIDEIPGMIGRALAALPVRQARLETWDDRIDALQKSAVAAFLFPQ